RMKLFTFFVLLGLLAFINGQSEDVAERKGRGILAAYRTQTVLSVTTATTTVPLTCYSTINQAACSRRRHRRVAQINELTYNLNDADNLLGSLDDLERETRDVDSDREGRLALTIWSTTSSTFTFTSTSTDSATTFSVSFYCSIAGASFPAMCG
ncbi:unnamed protein product, partial [Meganyctiphanes norvegica]